MNIKIHERSSEHATHTLLLGLGARLGSLRLPDDTDPDKLTVVVAAIKSGLFCGAIFCFQPFLSLAISSDDATGRGGAALVFACRCLVNELKRIKTPGQTFVQYAASAAACRRPHAAGDDDGDNGEEE